MLPISPLDSQTDCAITDAQFHRKCVLGDAASGSPMKSVPCRVCGSLIRKPFLDHGNQPDSNNFCATAEEAHKAPTTSLQYGFCDQCCLVQMLGDVPPERLFTEDYAYVTGTSEPMRDYYAQMAQSLRQRWQPKTVIECGPNDGTLLQHFKDLDHLGIEPSANVAQMAREKGLAIEESFWGLKTACRLSAEGVTAARGCELFLAAHCLTHMPDLNDVLAGIDVVLAPDGVAVFEDPSLDVVIRTTAYDQLYSEHFYCLSLPAIQKLVARHGFQIIEALPVPTHGGSMRVTIARIGSNNAPEQTLALRMQAERYLTHPFTCSVFAHNVDTQIAHFAALVRSLKQRGQRIAILGASSKVVLALVRAGIGAETVDYASDTTPGKIGRFLPVSGIPVISREDAESRLPDVFINGARVHEDFILRNERRFLEGGGRLLSYIPKVKLIGA